MIPRWRPGSSTIFCPQPRARGRQRAASPTRRFSPSMRRTAMTERKYCVLGIDLGQGQDHSAEALVEVIEHRHEAVTTGEGPPDDERTGRREVQVTTERRLLCHHVHRFPLDLP